MIEIIAIGDELLQGNTVNSNAGFISSALLRKGYRTTKQVVVSDNEMAIQSQLKESISNASLVIVSGGLGPTLDDGTKQSVSRLLDRALVFNENIYASLKMRFPNLSSLKEQATLPEGAHPLENEVGTAPGLIFKLNTSLLILLPGVPSEMKVMFEHQVLPYLEKYLPVQTRIIQQDVGIFLIPEETIDPILKKMQASYPEIAIGIYPSLGYVKVRFTYEGKKDEKAKNVIHQLKAELQETFKGNIFKKSLEMDLQERLVQNHQSLILAESCTGGTLASKITAQSGSSQYFLGSTVCYSDEIKQKLLGVSKKTLQQHGAVSKEVVCEMLEGLFSIHEADFAAAISGIAGPGGGTKQKPVGTVYIGVAQKKGSFDVREVHIKGGRDRVIEESANICLAALLQKSVE